MAKARKELTGSIDFCISAEEVAENAEAILILTEWPQFRSADWKAMAEQMSRKLVLDGRNLFKPEEMERLGFEYVSIGRPTRRPQESQTELAAVNGHGK
jgi:UDPglucose 6-dehydrogenase